MSERAGRRSRRSRTGEWKMTVRGALRSAAVLRADWASATAGSAAPRAAHLLVPPAIQGSPAVRIRDVSASTQRSRDSRLGLDQLRRRTGRSPAQPTTHIPADLDRNRKGAPSPPRSNGQAFDEARNPVTVAGRRCRASGRVRPRWDQAFPCYSPLAWVVGAGPSAVPSGEHPPAGGPALLG